MDLGLDTVRNSYVGNELVRGVSGGERKRVSIGTEMVMSPSLMCVSVLQFSLHFCLPSLVHRLETYIRILTAHILPCLVFWTSQQPAWTRSTP